MTVAMTAMGLADFLAYEDGTETLHELEDGALIVMPPESDRNRRIATFLMIYLAQCGVLPQYLTMKTELVVMGARVGVRVPDLMVLSEELAAELAGATRSTVTLEMPPPRLVVEVVSPGKENIDRDYRYKRSQYEARGIAEYWIVDPIVDRVTILTRIEGLYETATFEGEMAIRSALLAEFAPNQQLTAAQVLASGT
ncbi:Uma2 family endonuclease [Alkalinema sp. FACHB-956]|uniref:Uma2 family endonuclease n=1 Tax=Alkalinema sp. FACHB-956 TaxID=2692768 RepID=UPI001683B693|nr:Uma2 family endonuclease [Alkalinema sp. FACHB-956]MBD2329548.1 Uma2 family endonuclease [Alkalinema sp. FACHB-956]